MVTWTLDAHEISDQVVLDAFPEDDVNHDNKEFFRNLLARRLVLKRCQDCGTWHTPMKSLCPSCLSRRVVASEVSGKGHIALLTWLHQSAGSAAPLRYPLAAVELDEQPGLRLSATLVDSGHGPFEIGTRVRLSWVQRGGVPVPVFTQDVEDHDHVADGSGSDAKKSATDA